MVSQTFLTKNSAALLATSKKLPDGTHCMNGNPQKRNTHIMLALTLYCTAMIFYPELTGLDGFEGGFAMSFVNLVLALTFGIVAIIFFRQARLLDEILKGNGLLAHWTYTPEQWKIYSEKAFATEVEEKRGLFFIVTAFALFFGVLFWVLDEEAGFYVFLVMLGLIGLVGFAWQLSIWLSRRQNRVTSTVETFISKDAVFMNRRLHCWRAPMTSFRGVKLENNRGINVLTFTYMIYNVKTGSQTYSVRVPVPEGKKEEAEKIVSQLNKNE